ncbi:glycosyltransferase family 39 protein [Alteromonas mediterranea]|uniref:Uncharacterized protein n=1 Tax=Alteromonas mediterranea (strain DSM 17117 / CIP 110805 / LMG 28347 / Deep ecotype) TaxID=1774373 RepID=T2DL23_ALTMD|nr:glycosyltransferase family 39 protein [Alteromonas mediterranea]AGV54051.1 hypothetical protein MADE_000001022310 [Alteromonas mediterranea DE]CAH1199239.1 hypothetical protein ISS312_03153 [Alteromonas mediterranea]|tara:strand:- start:32706 stop:34313 length:1608 start_codon:yes stop_codon:yes gene_type:complete
MLVKKRSPIVYAVFLSLLFLIIYSSMIPWGLPFYLDPDEHIFIRASLEMFSQPYFHPQWFGAPGSTFITIQAIGFGLVAFLGTLLGVFSSPQEFSQLYWTGNGDLLFIIGRSISSVFTSLVVLYTFVLFYNISKHKLLSLFGAFLTAITHLIFYYSAVGRMDPIQTLSVMVSLHLCILMIQKRQINATQSTLLALAFSVSVFSKYPSVILVVPIVYTYCVIAADLVSAARALFRWGMLVLLFSFMISPYFFLDFTGVWDDVTKEARTEHLSSTSFGFFSSFAKYFTVPLYKNYTLVGVLLGIVGMLTMLFSKERYAVIPLFFLTYLAFLSALNLWWERWIIPLLPLFSIFILYTVYIASKNKFSAPLKWIALLLLFLISSSSAVESYKLYKDRVTNNFNVFSAESWIMNNLAQNINVLVDVYTPPLLNPRFNLYQRDCKLGVSKIEITSSSRVIPDKKIFECMEDSLKSFVVSLKEHDISVVILSDLHLRLKRDIENGGPHIDAAEEYDWLFNNFNVIKAFEEGNGRPVYILKRS